MDKTSEKKMVEPQVRTPLHRPPEKRDKLPWLIAVFAIIAIICIAVVTTVILVNKNEFVLSIELSGKEALVVDYGTEYTDPGAEAYFFGTVFFKQKEACVVKTEGEVNTNQLGEYILKYTATYELDIPFFNGEYEASIERKVTVADISAPEITLEYVEGAYTLPGHAYEEEGYRAMDNHDGDLTENVFCEEKDGKVYYSVSDSFGNEAKVVREIFYDDPIPPEINLEYIEGSYTLPGHSYEEEGYSAADNCDGDITKKVTSEEKDGKVYYTVYDSYGNKAQAVREIFYDDPIPPEMKLLGDGDIVIAVGGEFRDPGLIVWDNVDLDITDRVTVTGSVNTSKAGSYTLTYSASDSYNNTVTKSRTVKVKAYTDPKKADDTLYAEPLNPNGRYIYLTFDDGPGAHTDRLLDTLDKYGVKATFFVVNTKNTAPLARMAEAGHTIAIHSYTHDYNTIYQSEEAYFNDLNLMRDLIIQKTGVTPTVIRFPGGGSNLVSRFNPGIMTILTAKVKEQGYRYYDWNVDSDDAGGTKSTEGIIDNIKKGVSNYYYSIVLQHDIYGFSVDAVEEIIVWGLENGYSFRALTQNSPVCEHRVKN